MYEGVSLDFADVLLQEGESFSIVFDLVGFELDAGNSRQTTMVMPDRAQFWLVPGDSAWKQEDNLMLAPGSSFARPDTWRVR